MDLQLTDKIALVTASTGGIGQAIATSLAREGASVVINGRSAESVQAAIARVGELVPGSDLTGLVADNGTAEGAEQTFADVPDVDILVNNLGIYQAEELLEAPDDSWRELMEVNVMSAVRLSRHYLPRMLDKDAGRILLLASEAAIMPSPEMAHYSASKAAVLSLSRSLAELTKGSAVTVNALVAGSTKTEGVQDLVTNLYPGLPFDEAEAAFMGPDGSRHTSLIQRLIDPNELGDIAAFLVSPRSSAINGAAVRADGGLIRSMI